MKLFFVLYFGWVAAVSIIGIGGYKILDHWMNTKSPVVAMK